MFKTTKLKVHEIDSIAQGLLLLKDAVDKNGGATAKLSYKVARFNQKIANVLSSVQDQRNELIKKYGKEDEGNYSIDQASDKNKNAFFKEFNELMQVEEEVHVLDGAINLTEFGDMNVPIDVFERLGDYIDGDK
tara:strand:+ start:4138 stop:4539 length:402 start_codon:yes stop_codon:yes gene_type:complete